MHSDVNRFRSQFFYSFGSSLRSRFNAERSFDLEVDVVVVVVELFGSQ